MPSSPSGSRALPALAILFAAVSSPSIVHAQCLPDPASPGATVTCGGTDSDGFTSAFDDLTINVGGTVNSPGPGSAAFDLSGARNSVNLTGSANITPSFAAVGIRFHADDGVAVIGSGASINVDTFTAGVVLEADDAQITIDGSITGVNLLGHGVLTFNTDGTQVTVGATGSVITTGDDSRGIDLQASNSSITVAGTVSTSGGQTTGDAAHALIVGDGNFATTGGMIELLSTAQVSTSGEGAGGVLVEGSGPTVSIAQGASVAANGDIGSINGIPSFGVGMNASNGVAQNDGNIAANPATGSLAVLLAGTDSVFNNNATGVLVGGGLAPVLQVAFAFLGGAGTTGTLNNRGTITGSVLSFDAADAVVNHLAGGISGSILLGPGNDTVDLQAGVGGDIELEDGSDRLTVADAALTSGTLRGGDDSAQADGFVDVLSVQSGARSFAADQLTGWEIIELPGDPVIGLDFPLLTVSPDAGTDGGSGLPFGLNIGGEATLELFQSLVVAGNVQNSGEIRLTGDGVPSTTLTLNNAYSGSSGIVVLDVVVGDDASAADRLVVPDGAGVTGTTGLRIENLGGPGAATTGDGILVVETQGSGATTADAFTLDRPLRVGDFEYMLLMGGLADPDDGNWYLRSALVRPVPALPPAGLLLCWLLLVLAAARRLRGH